MDGRRTYVSLGPDERQARAQYAQLLADREAGRVVTAGPRSAQVGAIVERFLEEARGELAASTIDQYERAARRIVTWFGSDTPVASIERRHIDGLRATYSASHSRQTVGIIMAVLNQSLKQAERDGLLDKIPTATPPPRRQHEDIRDRLSLADLERVIAALPEPWNAVAEIALLTGLRRGEILGLEWADVDLRRKTLRVTPTGNLTRYGRGRPKSRDGVRTIRLSPRTVTVLKGLPRTGPRVIDATPDQAAVVIRETLRTLGLWTPRRGWHEFRHCHATLMDAAGLSLRQVNARLGHGSLHQTLAYGQAPDGDVTPIDRARQRVLREESRQRA